VLKIDQFAKRERAQTGTLQSKNPCNSTSNSIIVKTLQKLNLLLFYNIKSFLKSFRRYIRIWCDFLKVGILVFLAFWQMDGF
jgi:hypothetical protein